MCLLIFLTEFYSNYIVSYIKMNRCNTGTQTPMSFSSTLFVSHHYHPLFRTGNRWKLVRPVEFDDKSQALMYLRVWILAEACTNGWTATKHRKFVQIRYCSMCLRTYFLESQQHDGPINLIKIVSCVQYWTNRSISALQPNIWMQGMRSESISNFFPIVSMYLRLLFFLISFYRWFIYLMA